MRPKAGRTSLGICFRSRLCLSIYCQVAGVVLVTSFCDAFQSLVKGIRTVHNVLAHVKDFDDATGLIVQRTKSKFIPHGRMSTGVKRSLNNAWDGASIVDRTVSLGCPIGLGVTNDDVSERGVERTVCNAMDYACLVYQHVCLLVGVAY